MGIRGLPTPAAIKTSLPRREVVDSDRARAQGCPAANFRTWLSHDVMVAEGAKTPILSKGEFPTTAVAV